MRRGDFSLYKVDGEMNPADIFTKACLTSRRIEALLDVIGCWYMGGRSSIAPKLRKKDENKKAITLHKGPPVIHKESYGMITKTNIRRCAATMKLRVFSGTQDYSIFNLDNTDRKESYMRIQNYPNHPM